MEREIYYIEIENTGGNLLKCLRFTDRGRAIHVYNIVSGNTQVEKQVKPLDREFN